MCIRDSPRSTQQRHQERTGGITGWIHSPFLNPSMNPSTQARQRLQYERWRGRGQEFSENFTLALEVLLWFWTYNTSSARVLLLTPKSNHRDYKHFCTSLSQRKKKSALLFDFYSHFYKACLPLGTTHFIWWKKKLIYRRKVYGPQVLPPVVSNTHKNSGSEENCINSFIYVPSILKTCVSTPKYHMFFCS